MLCRGSSVRLSNVTTRVVCLIAALLIGQSIIVATLGVHTKGISQQDV
jgi:hypothetical protein